MSTVTIPHAELFAPPRPARVRLMPMSSHSPRLEFAIEQLPVIFGRDQNAHVQLHDPWVSRRHCEIAVVGSECVVRDLESKHGTYVNDIMIIEKYLRPGDELSIGLSTFRIGYDEI